MNVLFYSSADDEIGRHLQKIIGEIVPEDAIEIYRTIHHLTGRLHRPRYNLNLAIVMAASREELSEIVCLSDLLWDMRIILILPDDQRDTISKGHLLRPRFLSYADSDFSDVAAVLTKMFENTHLTRGVRDHI